MGGKQPGGYLGEQHSRQRELQEGMFRGGSSLACSWDSWKPAHLQWPERGEHYWEARTEGHAEARWSRAVGHGKGLRLYRKPDRSHGSDMV